MRTQVMRNKKDNIYIRLIETIKQYIPDDDKIISRLEEILDISQQSIYRRLRGEIPFTFEEVTKIALNLRFSLDEIMGKYYHKGTFLDLESFLKEEMDIIGIYNDFIDKAVGLMNEASSASYTTLISARNKFPLSLLLRYENLTKFKYFKVRHLQEYAFNESLSEITLTLGNKEAIKRYMFDYKRLNNIELIVDNNALLSMIKEITYFYKRKLIFDSELLSLQEELRELVDYIEKIMSQGKNDVGSQVSCYLSTFNIETNYSYIQYDEKMLVKFWAYAEIPMIISDPRICLIQKDWLDSLKKYSTLITGSNELQRIHYLDKQREHIDNIGKDIILEY